jgi:hypothetical protein
MNQAYNQFKADNALEQSWANSPLVRESYLRYCSEITPPIQGEKEQKAGIDRVVTIDGVKKLIQEKFDTHETKNLIYELEIDYGCKGRFVNSWGKKASEQDLINYIYISPSAIYSELKSVNLTILFNWSKFKAWALLQVHNDVWKVWEEKIKGNMVRFVKIPLFIVADENTGLIRIDGTKIEITPYYDKAIRINSTTIDYDFCLTQSKIDYLKQLEKHSKIEQKMRANIKVLEFLKDSMVKKYG